ILMIGWATGGILFGMMSDRYGRVKAMVATLLAYTIFSGLSGLARSNSEFMVYRFLCGMGVGGMFGAATTLLAESVPPRFGTIVGVCLGVAGMVGLWGIAFFSPELITTAFKNRPLQAGEIAKPEEICLAFKAPPNSAVAHLKSQFSADMQKAVDQVEAGKEAP